MRLLCGSVLLAALAPFNASAQLLPEGVMFDDFAYTSTAWSRDVRQLPAGSLYGPNRWRTGPFPADTLTERAWYRGYWYEMDDFYEQSSVEVADGILRLRARPGRYSLEHRDPQIASGMVAVTGTWAAQVRFSDLGAVPLYETGPHQGWPLVDIMQAFWTLSPYRMVRDEGVWTWSEIDHEFNNWFGKALPFDRAARVYPHTGFFEDGGPHIVAMRADDGAAPYTCTLTPREDSVEARPLPASACTSFLLGQRAGQDGAPFVTLVIQHDGEGVRFSLRAEDSTARLDMASLRHTALVPSQPMMAMFSTYLNPHVRTEQEFQLGTAQPLEADWFFYAGADLDMDAVLEQVATLRGIDAVRVNTLGRTVAAPYVGCDQLLPRPSWETCPWPRTAALDSTFTLQVTRPDRLSTRCLRKQEATWIVRPPLRRATYSVGWTSRYHYTDRPPSSWYRAEQHGVRYTPPPPTGSPHYVEVRVRVEDTDPHAGISERGTYALIQPVTSAGSPVGCTARVDPDPLATAPGRGRPGAYP